MFDTIEDTLNYADDDFMSPELEKHLERLNARHVREPHWHIRIIGGAIVFLKTRTPRITDVRIYGAERANVASIMQSMRAVQHPFGVIVEHA